MKRIIPLFTALLFTIMLIGCAAPLHQPQPVPSNAEGKVKAMMDDQLFDGESARFKNISGPKLKKTGRGLQYVMTFDVNAKNRLGGYVGYKPYIAFFKDGQVDIVIENTFGMHRD